MTTRELKSRKQGAKAQPSPITDVRGAKGDVRMCLPGKDGTYRGAAVQPHAGKMPKGFKEELRVFLSQIRLRSHVPDFYNVTPVSCAGMLYRGAKRQAKIPHLLYEGLMEAVALSFTEVKDTLLARRKAAVSAAAALAEARGEILSLASAPREDYPRGLAAVALTLRRAAEGAEKVEAAFEEDEFVQYLEVLVANGHADEAADEIEEAAAGSGKKQAKGLSKLVAEAAEAVEKAAVHATAADTAGTRLEKALKSLVNAHNKAEKMALDAVEDTGLRLVFLRDLIREWKDRNGTQPPSPPDGTEPAPVTVAVTDDHTPKMKVEINGSLKAEQGGAGHLFAYPLPDADGPEVAAFPEGSYGGWNRSEVCAPLKASGGYLGGGSETLLLESPQPATLCLHSAIINRSEHAGPNGSGVQEEISNALDTGSKPHALFYEDAEVVDGCEQADKDSVTVKGKPMAAGAQAMDRILLPMPTAEEEDVEAAIRELDEMEEPVTRIAASMVRRYRIRRLTPIETGRLQGMPDAWPFVPAMKPRTGKNKVSDEEAEERRKMFLGVGLDYTIDQIKAMLPDSAIYRMHGNSMSVPVVRYILSRLVKAVAAWTPKMFARAA